VAWSIATNNSEILAIHAALLPTNQVLLFGGSEHNQDQNESGDPADLDNSRLFNLAGPTLLETITSPDTDVFCSGHSLLSDGRLLVAGGTKAWGGDHAGHGHALNFLGEHACWLYHPRARRWARVRDLGPEPGQPDGGGRWYPTLVTLANGESLAVAGHPFQTDSRHNNDTPERYTPAADVWTTLTAETLDPGVRTRYYPRFHVLPDGNVFFVSPLSGSCRVWNPYTGQTVGAPIPSPGGAALYNASWDFPSVLLPLLPEDEYGARVLIAGEPQAKRIDLRQMAPTWQVTAARAGAAAGKVRRFACGVMLPTGDAFITGGINGSISDGDAVLEGEIYTPGIDWATGQYTLGDSWASTDAATVPRNYHSTALLLPNGRVWTAGSSKNAAAGDPSSVGELRIELFHPPYDDADNRPQITQAPPSAGYGQSFEVTSPEAAQIRRVAITRCGSVTHAFDSDQRYVGLRFTHTGGNTLRVEAPPNSAVAPPGYYLLWLLNQSHLPCVEARFLRICAQRIQIVLDRSTFSTHEVEALGTPAMFSNAFYVVLDGFLPSEVGTPPTPPVLSFTRPDGTAAPDVSATLNRVLYEDDSQPPDIAQRITFVFDARFGSTSVFAGIPAADPAQALTLTARQGGNAATAPVTVSKNPNPYMRDGAVHWLSTDVRVFAARPGHAHAGVTLGAGANAPIDFIQQLLGSFNAAPADDQHPFLDISQGAQESRLELAGQVNGQPVFNFAVAKVRYRAPAGVDAGDVRVFFRMFNVAATGLEYAASIYPRSGDGAAAAPLLGLAGGEIASIPFFAEARQADMRNQVDSVNRRTIAGVGASEVTAYFGCWLDFNQPTPRFPLNPPHSGINGPFNGTLLSIQELVRNDHCCLVAEVHYPLDPIPVGATPGSHDNLSQRNLVVTESDNPGTTATHTVQSTFEIKPSRAPLVTPTAFGPAPNAPAAGHAMFAAAGPRPRVEPDELLFRWNNLPRDSRVSIYLPDVDVRQMIATSAARGGPHVWTARDDGTLCCRIGDASYLPIPGPRALQIPGLLTVELPPTVVKGQVFTATVHQIAGYPRKIVGSFQLSIHVTTADAILPRETRRLSVFRHIAKAIPSTNRWRAIWERLLGQVEDRVRGLGGDPGTVPASPLGEAPADPALGGGDEPRPGDRDILKGELARIVYDCHGRLEGFVLETCDGNRVVRTGRCGLEEILLRACRDHLQVSVDLRKGEVYRITVHCC
jgi:hypothetical protein